MDPGNDAGPAAVAAPRARSPVSVHAVAMALFVLACAAAVLALFVMNLDPDNSLILGPCAPTGAEVAELRGEAAWLLMAAVAQLVVAAVAVVAPAREPTIFACALGALTAYHAWLVLMTVVACHGRVQGALAPFDLFFIFLLAMALITSVVAALLGDV